MQRFIFFIVRDICFLLSQSWILEIFANIFKDLSCSLSEMFVFFFHKVEYWTCSSSYFCQFLCLIFLSRQVFTKRMPTVCGERYRNPKILKTLCSSCLVYSFGSKCLKFLWDLKFQKCLRWVFCESRSVTLSHKLLTSSWSPSNLPELENFQDVQDFPTDALFQTQDFWKPPFPIEPEANFDLDFWTLIPHFVIYLSLHPPHLLDWDYFCLHDMGENPFSQLSVWLFVCLAVASIYCSSIQILSRLGWSVTHSGSSAVVVSGQCCSKQGEGQKWSSQKIHFLIKSK